MSVTGLIGPFGFEIRVEIVVIGLIVGLIYGLFAIGLALVYRSARFFNFAHGEIGAVGATVMMYLVGYRGWPYLFGLLGALVTAVVVGFLVDFLVIRRLAQAPRLVLVVATIGLAQVLLAVNRVVLGADDAQRAQLIVRRLVSFPTPFEATVDIGSLRLQAGHLMILGVVPLIVLGLTLFLQRSRLGLATRAMAENQDAANLAGADPRRVSTAVWVLVALTSTAAAILLAPTRPLTAVAVFGTGPSLLARGLAAAVLGGMTSLPQVFAGGIAIGVAEQLILWNYPTSGLVEVGLFSAIAVAILVRRDLGRGVRGATTSSWSLTGVVYALEPRISRRFRVRAAKFLLLAALVGAGLALPLFLDLSRQVLATSMVLFAMMALSLVVLTGMAGQVSLGQFAFVGLGAVLGGRLHYADLFLPIVEVLLVLAAAAIAAVLVGLPALRISGLLLAATTLAFSLAGGAWLLRQNWMVVSTGFDSSLSLPREHWLGFNFGDEHNYYRLCLVVLVVTCFAVAHLRKTGFGRRLVAVRDNDAAAATMAIPTRRVKLQAFVVSGVIATLAGYLYGGLLVNFGSEPLFAVGRSLDLVAMVVFGGVTSVTGAILGAVWVRGIPYFFNDTIGLAATGIGLLVILQILPSGLASLAFRVRDAVVSKLVGEPVGRVAVSERAEEIDRHPLPPAPAVAVDGLPLPIEAIGVQVRFGGVMAVGGVNVEARHGEIVGLIGPNGAGKTTLFDVLTGQLQPSAGRVTLHGHDVTGLRPDQRAKRGLGRSFQEARLYPEVSLLDTFKLALEREHPSWSVSSLLALPPSWRQERLKARRAEEVLELLGLTRFAGRNCGELSTGTRRFAELGCLLAMGCDVLLLDEPTAGIAQREVEQFAPVLREIRANLGATMIVIDHDMPMMMSLVDRMYVMSLGTVIAEGPPSVLRNDSRVVSAYLGTNETAIQRSGAPSITAEAQASGITKSPRS